VHEPIGREAGELAAHQPGNLGLISFEQFGSGCLSEMPGADGFGYTKGQVCLGETLFGVGEAAVGEDVSATFFDFDFFSHRAFPLSAAVPTLPMLFFGALEPFADQIHFGLGKS